VGWQHHPDWGGAAIGLVSRISFNQGMTILMSFRRSLGLAIAAVALVACSGGDDDDASSAAPSEEATSSTDTPSDDGASGATGGRPNVGACALFDPDEVADLLGGAVTASPSDATDVSGELCRWNRSDLRSGAGVVSLTFLVDTDVQVVRDDYESNGGLAIGDGALLESQRILVLIGDRAFVIDASGGPVAEDAALESLARTAVERS